MARVEVTIHFTVAFDDEVEWDEDGVAVVHCPDWRPWPDDAARDYELVDADIESVEIDGQLWSEVYETDPDGIEVKKSDAEELG